IVLPTSTKGALSGDGFLYSVPMIGDLIVMYFELSSAAPAAGACGAAGAGAACGAAACCIGWPTGICCTSVVVSGAPLSVVVLMVILKSSISNLTSVAPDFATNLIRF